MSSTTLVNTIAEDLMIREVISIRADSTLREAWRILMENKISGAPVVNQQGELVGVISQQDIVRHLVDEEGELHERSTYYYSLPALSTSFVPSGENVHELLDTAVEEVMNPYVIAVSASDRLPVIAATMKTHHIHRVIVQEKRKVVGVISTFDLLSLFENH